MPRYIVDDAARKRDNVEMNASRSYPTRSTIGQTRLPVAGPDRVEGATIRGEDRYKTYMYSTRFSRNRRVVIRVSVCPCVPCVPCASRLPPVSFYRRSRDKHTRDEHSSTQSGSNITVTWSRLSC